MSGELRKVYCKHCGQRCKLKMSRTEENPGRPFWACPLELGHGWMDWADSSASSPSYKDRRFLQAEVTQLKEENASIVRELTILEMKYEDALVHIKFLLAATVLSLLFLFLSH